MCCLSLQRMNILIYALNLTKTKPILVDFYNSQSRGADIIKEMLKDYSSQSVSNSWTVAVLSRINAQTVFSSKIKLRATQRYVPTAVY